MFKRIVTGLVFFGIFMASVRIRSLSWVMPLIITAGGLAGIAEFRNMAVRKDVQAPLWLSLVLGLMIFADAWVAGLSHLLSVTAAGLCLFLVYAALLGGIRGVIVKTSVALMSTVYVAIPMALGLCLFRMEISKTGFGLGMLVFIVVVSWSCDTGAYFVGSAVGKRKIAPVLSPNKTVEGSIGGLVASILAALLLLAFWHSLRAIIPWLHGIALGFLIGFLGQVGDLAESAFKRDAGVKDSGNTVIGHGGMLDVIDSLLLTIPLCYLYFHHVLSAM